MTLAAALAPRLALGCSDIALQMRRLLILQSLKHPKKKLIIENRNKDTLCPILKTNSNTLTIFKVKTDVLYVILIKKYMYVYNICIYTLCDLPCLPLPLNHICTTLIYPLYKKHKITMGSCLEWCYVGAPVGVCVCPIIKRLIDTFT